MVKRIECTCGCHTSGAMHMVACCEPDESPAVPHAEYEAVKQQLETIQRAQPYTYINKAGRAVLARDMENEIDRLRAALLPFAAMADSWSESEPDETMMDYHEEDGAHINLGHCRAARAALHTPS